MVQTLRSNDFILVITYLEYNVVSVNEYNSSKVLLFNIIF